jgi:HSP20 family protein
LSGQNFIKRLTVSSLCHAINHFVSPIIIFGIGTAFETGVSIQKIKIIMTHVKFMNNGNLLADACNPKNFSRLVDNFLAETLNETSQDFSFRPRVDILEKENSFELYVLLPGLTKENISLETEGSKLIISGERAKYATSENEKFHQVESFSGKFKRSFNLPKNVDTDSIKAAFKNGILEISIEKTGPAKSGKVIEIE